MKLRDKIACLKSIIKCRLFQKSIPIAVRWQLTNRCALQCKYCNIWRVKMKELSLSEVIEIINELAVAGTKRISFSDGEPLLREDINEIIHYCRTKGIYPEMN